jgi:hypothetical protein
MKIPLVVALVGLAIGTGKDVMQTWNITPAPAPAQTK